MEHETTELGKVGVQKDHQMVNITQESGQMIKNMEKED